MHTHTSTWPQRANTQAYTLTASLFSPLWGGPLPLGPGSELPPPRVWAHGLWRLRTWAGRAISSSWGGSGTQARGGGGGVWGLGPGLGQGAARGRTSSSWICLWASTSSSSAPESVRSRRPFSALSRTVSSWLRSFSRSTWAGRGGHQGTRGRREGCQVRGSKSRDRRAPEVPRPWGHEAEAPRK